ncbi:hypothetical protein JOB18_039965 [Solea senegalensis]|uniref:Uncharacterized protein n=1 Tax=Solea senegalensis TaxID=28829 RepID=A0AAV6PC62_SOLSE|nr:intracellular protein transport protein USO1-like [Solea senegalensis]KAG7454087.1 hypothetical protein JOB18_039965 [Solea senegalensis]
MSERNKDAESLCYIKWQFDQLRHQHEYSTELWGNRVSEKNHVIKTLEEQVASLQKAVKEGKIREEELREMLEDSKETTERLTQAKTRLETSVLKYSEMQQELKKELKETHERLKAALTETEALTDSVMKLQEEVDEWRTRTSELDKSYAKMKHNADTEASALKHEIEELKKAVAMNELSIKELVQDMDKKEKELEKEMRICAKYEETIISLKNQHCRDSEVIRASHNKFNELVNLHQKLNEKNVSLQSKIEQADHLKPAVRNLQEQVHRLTDANATLHAAAGELCRDCTRLEGEKLQAALREEDTVAAMQEVQDTNNFMTKELELLTSKVQYNEQEFKRYKNMVEKLMKRVVEDLDSCISVIDKPNELRARVIEINDAVPASYRKSMMEKESKSKPKPLSPGTEVIYQNTRRAKERLEQKVEIMQFNFNKERSNLIKIINEQIHEIDVLKKTLQAVRCRRKVLLPAKPPAKSSSTTGLACPVAPEQSSLSECMSVLSVHDMTKNSS